MRQKQYICPMCGNQAMPLEFLSVHSTPRDKIYKCPLSECGHIFRYSIVEKKWYIRLDLRLPREIEGRIVEELKEV